MYDLVTRWYEEKQNVDEMLNWKWQLKEWEKKISAYFPIHARILDIGCGLGREAFALSDLGHDIVGIDISKEVISQVKHISSERGYHIPFFEYDGEHLDFATGSFDVVLIWAQTFGLFYGSATKTRYLAECNRVLKKGGLLSFSGHDYTFLKDKYPDCLRERKFFHMSMVKFIGKHLNPMNCRTLPSRPAWTLFCVKKERFIGLRTGRFCIACAKKRTEN